MHRSDRQTTISDTISRLAAKRASLSSALPPPSSGVLVEVELDKIEPNPDQPRQWIDPEKIEELAASITSRGTRQPDNPILVRPTPEGDRFLLVSGERRWRAKQWLREQAPAGERQLWNTIKALLHDDIDDEKSAFIALEENLQREDLSPVEEGAAYVKLMERYSARSTKALAARIGKPENRIQQMIRLHGAPQFLRDAVMKGALVPLKDEKVLTEGGKPKQARRRLEFRAAFEFLKLFDHLVGQDPGVRESPKAREKIETRVGGWVEHALADGWSVRRIEEHCAALKTGRETKAVETGPQVQLPPIETSGCRLVLHSARLSGMGAAERCALLAQVAAFLGLEFEAMEAGHHVVAPASAHAFETASAGASKG